MSRKYVLIAVPILLVMILAALVSAPRASFAQVLPTPTFTQPYYLTPAYLPTATPTLPLTPQPTSAAPGCGSVFPIAVGDLVLVRGGVSVRAFPGVNAPLMTTTTEQTAGWYTLLDGPVCADNYTWWQVWASFDVGTRLEPELIEVHGWLVERNTAMLFFLDHTGPELICPSALDLVVGEEIELVNNVRVRSDPSLSGLTHTIAPAGTVAEVLDAQPVCADGYIWRKVRVTVANFVYDGWMAEGPRLVWDEATGQYLGGSYLDIAPECYAPLGFSVGDLGRVDYRGNLPKNLRDAPSYNAAILYTLVEGIPLEIIGGPVCAEGMNWWQVRIMSNIGATGWLAEGRRGDYWIRDFYDHPDLDPYRCCDLGDDP